MGERCDDARRNAKLPVQVEAQPQPALDRPYGYFDGEIRCAPENFASRAVPKRLGFTEEGLHRQVLAIHGGFQDLIMYAMLAKDWREHA